MGGGSVARSGATQSSSNANCEVWHVPQVQFRVWGLHVVPVWFRADAGRFHAIGLGSLLFTSGAVSGDGCGARKAVCAERRCGQTGKFFRAQVLRRSPSHGMRIGAATQDAQPAAAGVLPPAMATKSKLPTESDYDEVHVKPLVKSEDAAKFDPNSAAKAEAEVDPALRTHTKPIRVDVDLVLVPVTITDPMNRLVTGLEKENFILLDNGEKQAIRALFQRGRADFAGRDLRYERLDVQQDREGARGGGGVLQDGQSARRVFPDCVQRQAVPDQRFYEQRGAGAGPA